MIEPEILKINKIINMKSENILMKKNNQASSSEWEFTRSQIAKGLSIIRVWGYIYFKLCGEQAQQPVKNGTWTGCQVT